jgi:nitroreductase
MSMMKIIKSVIKGIIPKKVLNVYKDYKINIEILPDFIYDYKRFIKQSASSGLKNKEWTQAFLIREYHSIEKGLTLRNTKPGFGLERIAIFMDVLVGYEKNYGRDFTVDICISTLKEYAVFDKNNNRNFNPLIEKIEDLSLKFSDQTFKQLGGFKKVLKSDVVSTLNFDFEKFFKSRHSVRDFTDEPVSREIVLQAIENSLYTPSVCNRQAWKVYLIDHTNEELKTKFLNVQNGNKGFGEHISSLLVVTGKLSSFFNYERNQVYIDGGMFAMSLVLSLHSKGLGTCCLNNSFTAAQNDAFMNVTEMDKDCVPIMYIAIGNLKDEYKVALSQRKSIDEIVEIINIAK